MRLAVLIPAHNEAPRVGGVISAVREVLPEVPVFVVDSGCTDETSSVAARAGATVIVQGGSGYAGALGAGYRHLAAAGFEGLVQLDADGQHLPSDAPRLIAALSGANIAFGSRVGSPGALARRVGNAVLAAVVRATCGARLADVTCGYQAMDGKALRLFADRFPEAVADANVRVYAVRAGLRVVEAPVSVAPRSGGTSMHDGLAGVRNLGASLRAVWEEGRRLPREIPGRDHVR